VEDIVLRGVAVSGLGKAAQFTDLPWVWRQFADKLKLNVWPGTFNVRIVDPESRSLWERLRQRPGIPIDPPDPSACVAWCYPVVVNEWIRGAIVLPHVPGYPSDQVEVVAAESIRAGLNVGEGASVTLRVLAPTEE